MEIGITFPWRYTTTSILLCLATVVLSAKVTVRKGSNTVQEGGILSLFCEAQDLQQHDEVRIMRTGVNFKRLTLNSHVDPNVNDEKIFIAERQVSGGKSYLLTIIDANRNKDEGNYTCKVESANGEEVAGQIAIPIEYFPSKPICSNPDQIIEGTLSTFNCSSDVGNPPVTLSWSHPTADIVNPYKQASDSKTSYLVLKRTFTIEESGSVLTCTVQSSRFPLRSEDCRIPITVKARPASTKITDKPEHRAVTETSPALSNVDCQDVCPFWASRTYIWKLVTFSTCAFAFIMLIITMVLGRKICTSEWKQRRMSRRRSQRQQSMEIYEKVEQFQDERRLYMPLQTREKPECIVVVPKDVEGEYTRTPTMCTSNEPMFT